MSNPYAKLFRERNKRRSFGPTVRFTNGVSRASCDWCIFRSYDNGHTCTHVKPARAIPDIENTPDWCEMLEGTLKDVREMEEKRLWHEARRARPERVK